VVCGKVLEFASWADKWETSKDTLSRLTTTANAGSTPQRLHVKAPVFQLTTEFRESGLDAFKAVTKSFADGEKTYQASVVSSALEAKKAETLFWESKINVSEVAKVLENLVDTEWRCLEPYLQDPYHCSQCRGKSDFGTVGGLPSEDH
jgi:hypothetical protein